MADGQPTWKKDTEDGGGPNDNPPAPGTCKRYIPVDGDIKNSPTISAKFRDRVYVASGVNVYAISTENTTVNGVNFPACTIIWKSPPLGGTIFSSVSSRRHHQATLRASGRGIRSFVYS